MALLPPHIMEIPVGRRRGRLRLVCWPCSALREALEPRKGAYAVRCCAKDTRAARARFLRIHRRCGFLGALLAVLLVGCQDTVIVRTGAVSVQATVVVGECRR